MPEGGATWLTDWKGSCLGQTVAAEKGQALADGQGGSGSGAAGQPQAFGSGDSSAQLVK